MDGNGLFWGDDFYIPKKVKMISLRRILEDFIWGLMKKIAETIH